jgi:hypothetical protein
MERTSKKSKRALQGILFIGFLYVSVALSGGTIEDFLEQLPVSNVRVLEKEAFYSSIYEVMFEQPVDHSDPSKGTFMQRLYISHTDASLPVILSTEGYSADYYYTTELASMLKCNQIIAEHRYFGKSVPDSVDYTYLTTWQAASDHHRIIEVFKDFYKEEWVTTGISKGGQTVMFHRYYYPDDVDASVPYVAPLNNDTEDLRIYSFLDEVGPKKCRRRIRKFQVNALKRQADVIPEFKEFSDRKGYTYERVGGTEIAYEYCVLEYSFAFWQWGYSSCSDIPGKDATPEEIVYHLNKVAAFDYFADEFVTLYQPFFYQAYTEMGYYGYDLDRFGPYLNHVTEPGFQFALPQNRDVLFDSTLFASVENYIRNEADNFIFIYGEWDTWSATAVELSGATNSRIFFKESGSHRTRIRNMPEKQQEEIMSLLSEFLED